MLARHAHYVVKPLERSTEGRRTERREGTLAKRQENRNVAATERGLEDARGFQRDIEVNAGDALAIKLGPRVECFGRP